MEKFKRLGATFDGMILEARLDVMAELANAHSDAIEAHSDDLESLTSRVRRLERRSLRRNDELLAALEGQWGCRIRPEPLRWPKTMTADEAVAIVVVEFEKMYAKAGDIHLCAWLERIRGKIVAALREHGREDR